MGSQLSSSQLTQTIPPTRHNCLLSSCCPHRTSASPRPSLQRTSSGSHGGSASAGSTAKGGGSSKGAKGLGSASGGVVKNSGHHAHGGQGGSTLRRALSCTDMSLDQSVMQKLVWVSGCLGVSVRHSETAADAIVPSSLIAQAELVRHCLLDTLYVSYLGISMLQAAALGSNALMGPRFALKRGSLDCLRHSRVAYSAHMDSSIGCMPRSYLYKCSVHKWNWLA
eukprot:1157510-Pelagomonas_calceolata.AAC.7